MSFAGLIMSSRAVVETAAEQTSNSDAAGTVIGGGLFATLAGTLSFVMAGVCFFSFLVSYFLSKDLKEDRLENSKECPECAELINARAKKCKHCGCDLLAFENKFKNLEEVA